MSLATLQLTLAIMIATALVEAAIFIVLIRRKLRTDFPLFLSYIALSACFNIFLFAVLVRGGIRSNQYFYFYWVVNTTIMLLQFGVMYEILKSALKPYTGLIDLGKMVFRWAGLFLLLVASLTALATSGSAATKCIAAVSLIERSLLLIQCGLLLLFFLFERRLALSWRSYPVSLALGLGTTAAVGLSLSYVGTYLTAWKRVLDVADTGSYLGVAVFWLACFARLEPAPKNVLDSPSKVIFQRWNEALLSAAAQEKNPALAAVDSFLPGIEKTVDRVLARKIAN